MQKGSEPAIRLIGKRLPKRPGFCTVPDTGGIIHGQQGRQKEDSYQTTEYPKTRTIQLIDILFDRRFGVRLLVR